nr:hypothetical protein CFP56_71934 [Quercus suber]
MERRGAGGVGAEAGIVVGSLVGGSDDGEDDVCRERSVDGRWEVRKTRDSRLVIRDRCCADSRWLLMMGWKSVCVCVFSCDDEAIGEKRNRKKKSFGARVSGTTGG